MFYNVGYFVGFVSTLGMAIFVAWAKPHLSEARLWSVLSFLVADWFLGRFMVVRSHTLEEAFFWQRVMYVGAIYLNVVYYQFVATLVGARERKTTRYFLCGGYVIATLLVIANITSHLFIRTMENELVFRYYEHIGPLYPVHLALYLLYPGMGIVRLMQERIRTHGPRRNQIDYVILASVIGFICGATTFPLIFDIPIPPFGAPFVPIYTFIIVYAIVKHQLLDITIVIRKTLLYSAISAGLAAAYAGMVTLLARLVESHTGTPAIPASHVLSLFGNALQTAFAPSCIVTALFSAGLGIVVWVKGMRKPVHWLWMMFCIAVAFWSLGYGMMVRSNTFDQALWWEQRIQYAGSIMIPILFLHFVILVSGVQSPRMLKGGYFLAVLLQLLNMAGMMVSVQVLPPFNYYTLARVPYHFFSAYFVIYVIYAHFLLIRLLRASDDVQLKNQVKFILFGTSIGFCGGATSFLLVYGISIFPYGIYAVPVYIVTVSYAIYRHQLMDINVVIRKTLLYSLVSAALAAVYVGTITLLVQVVGRGHGSTSAFSSALAAIFITLLFNPLRIRIQRSIDRYFPRERLDPGLLQEAAGGFAHEMKRPLAKISLPAELALMDVERIQAGEVSWEAALPKVKERLRFIMNQSIDAGYMIEAIRELSASSEAPFVPVDVRPLLEDALRVQNDLLEKHGVSIHLQMAQDLPQVSGRGKQLEIVFINLIKNAVEAMSVLSENRARELRIEARREGKNVLVRVKDSGSGIDPEALGRIFQPHYTTKGPHGTGMGLYLTSQMIQAHGGTIDVSSQPGQGTEFTVRLPTSTVTKEY